MVNANGASGSVRERLLLAASELFYEEGVHTVGIDRVLERAGVAKASLYATFGGKEELVCAYLRQRSEARQADIAKRMARYESPRDKILSVFELLEERVADSTYRGCAFLNASVEGPRGPTPIRRVAAGHRSWLSTLFAGLAAEMGVTDPHRVAVQLAVLYDGSLVGSLMEGTPETTAFAKRMAVLLLDSEEKAPKKSRARPQRKARRSA
jgi:AcrR family transcriptional regulator